MTVTVLDDTLSGSASTQLSGRTADTTGGAYSAWSGGINSTALVLLGDGTVSINAGSTSYVINASASTADDETCSLQTTYSSSANGKMAAILRGTGSGTGYLALFSSIGGSGSVQLYRAVSDSFTTIGSTASFDPTTSPTVALHVSGTGATVTVEALVNGSVIRTYSDTNAQRITSIGKPGIAVYDINSTSTGWRATRITATNVDPPASGTFTISSPIADQVQQRTAGASTGTGYVTGSYTGTPTTIEARLVQHGTNTVVGSFDWATVVASPSGGNFSFSVASIPAAQQGYDWQLRFSNDHAVTATSPQWFMGDVIAYWGQSNANRAFGLGSSTLTPNAYLRAVGNSVGGGSAWQAPDTATMDGAIAFGNAVITATGYPCGLVNCSIDGTAISTWNPGGTSWVPAMVLVNAASIGNARLGGVVWIQGEADSTGSMTTSGYVTELGDVFDAGTGLRTALGNSNLPVILVTLGVQAAAADVDTENIRRAQAQWCAAAPSKNLRVERWDLPTSDNLHLNASGHRTLGARLARAWNKACGVYSTYRGPYIASARKIAASSIDVTLTLDLGTDFTAGTGAWRIMDGGSSVAVSTATRQSASVVRLGMATSVSAPVIGYAYGSLPSPTGALVDNSALTLPLEWEYGVTASMPAYTTTMAGLSFGSAIAKHSATYAAPPTPSYTATMAGLSFGSTIAKHSATYTSPPATNYTATTASITFAQAMPGHSATYAAPGSSTTVRLTASTAHIRTQLGSRQARLSGRTR